jgi:hypothetical protein
VEMKRRLGRKGVGIRARRAGSGLLWVALFAPLLSGLTGCATLQGVLALRQVDFDLAGVGEARLAGVELERLRSYEDLGPLDLARMFEAVARGTLPLELRLDVLAENPTGNPEARLLALDWTFFLQDRETVSGGLPDAVLIPAGGSSTFPLQVRLDLLEFFQGTLPDLVNLALSVAGQEAPPTQVRLEAVPIVSTPLGPIRYPGTITIAHRDVGALR